MTIKEIFSKFNTIAVYGMSTNPAKPANEVPAYLQTNGYKIIPINPVAEEINGNKAYKTLDEVPVKIDILNVFRPSEEALKVVKEAVKRKKERNDIDVIWLQLGIHDEEAKKLAEENGFVYVEDKCMLIEHKSI